MKETVTEFNLKPKAIQSFVDNIPTGVLWKDKNSVYQGCNQYFVKSLGLSSVNEIIGKTDFELPFTKEESTGYRADDKWVMDKKIPKPEIKETLTLPDGVHLISTNKTPLIDDNGNTNGVFVMYFDMGKINDQTLC